MSVEFLPGDVPGDVPGNAPGDVPGDAPEQRYEPRRDRRPGGWALAALLAGAAVIWAVTRPAALPAPRTPATRAAATSAPAPTASATHTATARTGTRCHAIPDCSVRAGVPAALARLARAYLPQPARLSVQTVLSVNSLTHRDQLVRRDIAATVGSVTVVVRVQRGGSGTQAIVPDPPGIASGLIHDVNAGYVVRLQYLAPETVPPVVASLRAFLRDPRLVASG